MDSTQLIQTVIKQLKPFYQLEQPATTIHTERVLLRSFTLEDFSSLHQIYSNLELMKFIGKGARTPEETLAELTGFISHWQEHGFGPMAVVERVSQRVIGRSGLYLKSDRSRFPQLGYILSADYHGRGLGTEVAQASIAYGFTQLKVRQIDGFARVENYPSRHILNHKLGMRLETDKFQYEGRLYAKYTLTVATYLTQLSPTLQLATTH